MKQFEYEITKHPSADFSHLVFFCSNEGECNFDQVPADQIRMLSELLNEKGSNGWELAQMFFRKDGILIIWKRQIQS